MPEPEEITVWLDMPPAFIEACNSCHIEPQKALQFFIDHLSLYAHLKRRSNTVNSIVSQIFNGYIEERATTPEPDYEKRLQNVQFIRRLMRLIDSGISAAEKNSAYKSLVNEWYNALQ
jgi:hypothetical protein